MQFSLARRAWRFMKMWRSDLRAAAAKYFITREIAKKLEVVHAQEILTCPRNELALVRQKQLAEIQAVKDGKTLQNYNFDIVDRRSWNFPYIPEALHRLNQPILKNCFSADTEVLTKRGWVMWPNVREDDVFATYKVETGEHEWQSPQKIFRYWHEGEMYQFQNKFVDLLVTPDHLMLGRFRRPSSYENRNKESYQYSKVGLVRARKIKEFYKSFSSGVFAFEAPLTAKWAGKFPKNYNEKTGKIHLDCKYKLGYKACNKEYDVDLWDWVKFLGIYVAEGSANGTMYGLDLSPTSKKPHYVQAIHAAADSTSVNFYDKIGRKFKGYRVRVSQTPQSRWRKEIWELLLRLPFGFTEDLNDFYVSDKTLHSIVAPLGNSYTKRVPRWIKRLPPEYVKEFIRWACMGDGNGDGERKVYHTVSKKLADDVQELFQVSGSYACIVKGNNQKGFTADIDSNRIAPIYHVSEHLTDFGSVGNPSKVDYKGYVYCVALPNQTVYVRRNGIPSWCGRTPYNLRRFSETPIPRRAINLVKNSVLSFHWKVKCKKEFQDQEDPEREQRIQIVTETLKHPNLTGESDRDLLEAMLEDFLTTGAGCAEFRLTPDPDRPFKMWAVDASTVRIFLDWTESTPDRPRYAQMSGLKGERGIVTFLNDELIYIRDNIRTSTPFGLGRLEVSFNVVNSFLGAQDMAGRAGADQVHKTWLWWEVPLNPAHMQIVRRHIINELEGQAKVSLIAGAKAPQVIDVNPVTPEDLLLDWQKYLTTIIAVGFDVNPQDLGLEESAPKATAQVLADSTWKFGIVPVATRFQTTITRQLIHGLLGWEDLEFEFIGLEDPDQITKTVIQQRLWSMSALTPQEIRESNNLPELPGPFAKLTLFEQQLLMLEAQAKFGARSGTSGSTGMGMSSGMSSGMSGVRPPSSGSMGTGTTLGSGMQFAAVQDYYNQNPQDVSNLSPDMVQLYQELGILDPDSENVMNNMDQAQPGILDQLSDELTSYFKQELATKMTDEVQPAPITPQQRNAQIQKYLESMHQESLSEKVINRRGVFGPSINQQYRKAPERGKYPRSGGTFVDPNRDRVKGYDSVDVRQFETPLKNGPRDTVKTKRIKKHYEPGQGNKYQ